MSTNNEWTPKAGQHRVDRIWASLNQVRRENEEARDEAAS